MKINKHIKSFAITDGFIWSGNFLFSSIVALHLSNKLGGDPVSVIATGFSVYLIVRAFVQIPISKFLDSNRSHKDELYSMLLGSILMSLSFVGYELVQTDIHIYLINALFGLGCAFYLPAWRKNFAHFAERGSEGANYAYADLIFAVSGAIAAAVGGYLVQLTGTFTYVFYISSLFTLIGGLNSLQLLKDTN